MLGVKPLEKTSGFFIFCYGYYYMENKPEEIEENEEQNEPKPAGKTAQSTKWIEKKIASLEKEVIF